MMKNKDTFTLWGVQDTFAGRIVEVLPTRKLARHSSVWNGNDFKPVKLECRIVDQRPKKPRKPKTFTAHGLTWIPHTPGDLMPCDGEKRVRVLWRGQKEGDYYPWFSVADEYSWNKKPYVKSCEIIGWNYADAK
jgi:hypothetical protein